MQDPLTELVAVVEKQEVFREVLPPGEYVIGCEDSAQIRLASRHISQRHALLTVHRDHALIEDLGSDSGTSVNGQPVHEPTRLWPNQVIQVGDATLALRRVKTRAPDDTTRDPVPDTVRRLLPEEHLREKKYVIGRVVAEGGMGAILDAQEAATDRKVAMKVMLSQSHAGNVQRFIEEAQVTAQLEHPNIVPVHELSVDANEQVFYTMKFVRGDTLRDVLQRLADGHAGTVEKYPLAALLTIFQKICDALAFAHSRHVIHRDLKPANIMLGDFGEVLVMDWGLAKRLGRHTTAGSATAREDDSAPGFHTQDGAILGTPQYMAPEQARGEVEVLDARTDIYSLGAILFHLLALRAPVSGRSAREVVQKVARGEIEDLTQRAVPALPHLPDGRIPASLAAVTRQAMSTEPAARYQTVAELQADLSAYQTGFATRAEKAGAWKQLTLLVRRHRVVATVTAASLLVLTVVSALYTVNAAYQLRRAERARDDKEVERLRANDARAEAEQAKADTETALTEVRAKSQLATEKATEAEAQRALAKEALDQLRKAAPALVELVQTYRQEQKFAEALTRLSSAIALEPENADYLLLQAHLLQATEQLRAAVAVYEKVLTLPGGAAVRASAETNLQLSQEILRTNGEDAALTDASRGKLIAALRSQGRSSDAVLLDRKTEGGRKLAHLEIKTRLSYLVKAEENFNWDRHLFILPNKSFRLDLSGVQISQAPKLTGLPITELILDGNQALIGLDSLKGSRLERLSANRTPVADLTPLAGLPLTDLSLDATSVKDLEPLRNLPLKRLIVSKTPVENLAPLAGLPLEVLSLDATNCSDLRVLGKLPLRILSLRDLRYTIEVAPLTDCRLLEELALPKTSASADLLGIRSLPRLRRLTEPSFREIVTPAEYWQKRPPSLAEQAHLAKAMTALVAGAGASAGAPRAAWNAENLLELNLRGLPVTNLEPLRGLPITLLDLRDAPVIDFSPLAGTPVRTLILGGRFAKSQPAANFATLKKVTTLTELTIEDSPFHDLRDLAGLPLVTLRFPSTEVSDLAPLRGTAIQALEFPRTPVLDVRPLLEMDFLTSAYLSEQVTNATVLKLKPKILYGFDEETAKAAARARRRTQESSSPAGPPARNRPPSEFRRDMIGR